MKVAVIGSGGREHALGWKIRQSPLVSAVYGVPGNPGWRDVGECWTDIADLNKELVPRCGKWGVDLVVVGPEAPLVDGLADRLRAAGLLVFGPGADGAKFEGSKIASKEFYKRHGIPTAAFAVFDDAAAAKSYVRRQGAPIVIKADGLAAGKGVVVAANLAEAEAAIDAMLTERQFGAAGARIVVEACLQGEEVSVLALVDGKTIVPLAPAQDHKRIGDGDTGPNTGGMGAYVPTTLVDASLRQKIEREVLQKTLAGFRAEGIDFRGVIYCGLMIVDGEPYVLEYNVRFGDPECQPLLFHMKSDIVPYLKACAEGSLANLPPLQWHDGYSICVVMANAGYPGTPQNGAVIPNVDVATGADVCVFHAGTKLNGGQINAHGGRVLGVTSRGATIAAAQSRAYAVVDRLRWPGSQARRDIGWREAARK